MPGGLGFGSVAGATKAGIDGGGSPPGGSGVVPVATGASYNPAGQDLGADTFLSNGSTTARTLGARGADVFNPRDFGATGTGSLATIGTAFGSAATTSLAAFAAQPIGGAAPFSWMAQPQFGLQFSMATSADQGGAGTALTFLETLTGINNWSASVALWQDPAHGNYLVQPGMLVTDRAGAIASGTTVASVNRTPGPGYGTITLSKASTADVPSGDTVTFTIAPAQLRALTLDWLGIQSAMAGAWQAGAGGTVYIPSGNYMVNHSLINAGGITDTSASAPALTVRGDGRNTTRLTYTTDLGQDACAILGGGRGAGTSGESTYREFRLIGPRVVMTNGMSPNGMDGLCVGAVDTVRDFRADSMHAGINIMRDHVAIANVSLPNNGYGVYWAPYAPTTGGVSIKDSTLVGDTLASIGVATTDAIDSDRLDNVHAGFGPRGIYYEASPPNVTATMGGFITNSQLEQVYVEAMGGPFISGAGQSGVVDNNHFIGGGLPGVGVRLYQHPGQTVPALIYVDDFSNNIMEGTQWQPYSSVTDAIVETFGRCTGNTWYGDYAFVFNATATVAPLKCSGGAYQDTFYTGQGDGSFHRVYPGMSAGVAVTDNGNLMFNPFTPGTDFAGITAAASSSFQTIAILTRADGFGGVAKADPGQAIVQGQPLFATVVATTGLAGGLDQDGAVATAAAASPAGSATVTVDLDPGMKGGSGRATIGATAAGTTQASAYVVTAPSTQFSKVASGSGAVLGAVPIGRSIYIANDGASALLVYPQSGGQIGAASVNAGVPVAPGTSAVFRRLSTTLWHQ